MAEHILWVVLSFSKPRVDQWWALFVLVSSEILLVYFGREIWRRCD